MLNIGGVHGNEPGGIESVAKMINSYSQYDNENIEMDFIPCVNPIGYIFNERRNSENIDINRDFTEMQSSEAKIIDNYLKGKSYDLIIDHHEDPYAKGFSIIAHSNKLKHNLEKVVNEISLSGFEKASKLRNKENDFSGVSIFKLGTGKGFSQYAGLKHTSPEGAYVIETPTSWDIDKRISCHIKFFEKLLILYGQL